MSNTLYYKDSKVTRMYTQQRIIKDTPNVVVADIVNGASQGMWLDINDLGTVFQDHLGKQPVTATGQTVGLILSKDKKLRTTIINSNIDSNTTPSSNIYHLSNNSHYVSIAGFSVGYYRISINVTNITKGSLTIHSTDTLTDYTISSVGSHNILLRYSKTDTNLRLIPTDSTSDVSFQISNIERIEGNHVFQTTSAMRPILNKDIANLKYYLSFDGVDDSFVSYTVDFSTSKEITTAVALTRKTVDSTHVILELGSQGSGATLSKTFTLFSSVNESDYSFRAMVGATGNNISRPAYNSSVNRGVLIGTCTTLLSKTAVDFNGNKMELVNNVSYDSSAFSNLPLYIGKRGSNTAPFHGDIYSLICINRSLSETDTIALRQDFSQYIV